MSFNQSRSDKNKTQYRKTGRTASSNQQHRGYSPSYPKGTGAGGPGPSISSNRSYKKNNNNAQGGQSRASVTTVNTQDSGIAFAQRGGVQNRAHVQPQLHGGSDAPVARTASRTAEASASQRSSRTVPKAPTSQSASMISDTRTPPTPAKPPGDASKGFAFQFGSINRGFMNWMQIPARTSSAPPNLDEQKRDQARHDSFRAVPSVPVPTVPKQQLPRKDSASIDQPNAAEVHMVPRVKKDVQVSHAPPPSQTQTPSAHPMAGMSMPMPFHQPQVPVQFSGPNQQIQSQSMSASSIQMPMPMQLPIGSTQVQQPVFVPGLQPHPMQPQGIMHQGQNMTFTPQMGPQIPQMGNLGISMASQYPQQQGRKFGGPRKTPVKITHPDTHEELRLDKRTDSGGMDASLSRSDSKGGSEVFFSKSSKLEQHSAFVQTTKLSGITSRTETEGTCGENIGGGGGNIENIGRGGDSLTVSDFRDKPELSRTKSTISKGKKKRKEIRKKRKEFLPKADAAGVTSDLYGAYKNPEEKKGIENTESITTSIISKQVATDAPQQVAVGREKDAPVKAEPDDWEDAADISNPKLETSDTGEQGRGVDDSDKDGHEHGVKKYSRDFLLKFSNQFAELAEDFDIMSLIAEILNASVNAAPATASVEKKVSTETEGTCEENIGGGGDSLTVSDFRDKPELSRTKSTISKGKKKRKEILSKADTAGVTSDLHGAYKNPEEKKGIENTESIMTSIISKQVATDAPQQVAVGREKDAPVKAQPDDWEDAADISTPKLETSDTGEQVRGVDDSDKDGHEHGVKKYSRDFLLKFSNQFTELAEGFDIMSLIAEILNASVNAAPATASGEKQISTETEGTCEENIGGGGGSLTVSDFRDKPELSRTKSTISKGKKKRKEILSKADTAGVTSDLHGAYKNPEEKKGIENTESIMTSIISKQVATDAPQQVAVGREKDAPVKAQPDDWEDAADISTPKLETSDTGEQVRGVDDSDKDGHEHGVKKYSRDFLLKFSNQFTELAEGFDIMSLIAEILNASVNAAPATASVEKQISTETEGPCEENIGGGGDSLTVSDFRDKPELSRTKSTISKGKKKRKEILKKRKEILSKADAAGVISAPATAYVEKQVSNLLSSSSVAPTEESVPVVTTTEPEELLTGKKEGGMQRNNSDANRWQRDTNFQPKGLMASPHAPLQVMHKADRKYEMGKMFDKALMEPTFCEMIANFCCSYALVLPDFSEENEKITFKRLLLNKCQEEFERGGREQEETNKADEEGQVKQSEEEREEKRIKARRRRQQTPVEQDIEALCKLMSTIGEMIDHPKAKEYMDAYFERMKSLSNNMKLSSSVRDAAQERQAQSSRLVCGLGINPSARRGPPSPRGSTMFSSPNVRSFDRTLPTSPPTRAYGAGLTQNVPSENVLTEDRLRDMSLAAIREFYSSMHLSDVIILCVLKKSAYDLLNVIVRSILERKVGHVCSVPGE
ncbi:hypothetical protein ACFX13_041071 [Malus domestica]